MGERFQPGTSTWYASDSPTSSFSAVFEDDSETAYCYAYDRDSRGKPVLDAMHIYDVSNVVDRNVGSTVEIVWSADGIKAALLINDYPHAVIDFADRCSYCRTGFLSVSNPWRRGTWDDALMHLYRREPLLGATGSAPRAEIRYTWVMSLETLPGYDLIEQGLEDLASGTESVPALLVSVGAPRLRRLGMDVPRGIESPEIRLYQKLQQSDPDAAHSRYNALIRTLVSFERAAECAA